MAVFALTNEYLALNGSAVNVNDHVKSAVLTVDVAQLDSTAMGDTWVEVIGGLKSGQLAITFNDDAAASNIDSILWPLLGTVVTFEVRPTDSAVGAGNPKYTGSVLISQAALGGGVGELAAKSLTFPTSGTVTRAVA
jgi:hypothetical protein